MWTEHTEYEEYHKLQLCTVFRYQHNNTKYRLIIIIEKIPQNIKISFFFNIAHP